MKKAVFLVNSEERLNYVYNKEMMEKLSQAADFYTVPISIDNFLSHKDALKEAEVAFSTWSMPQFSEEQIKEYMPKLKILFYAAGSVQYFAKPFLNCGVSVVSSWAANAVPVAEYTVAQILLSNKGFFQLAAINKKDHSEAVNLFQRYPGNYNVKVGLLGAGMIGSMVIELLRPYNLEVLVFDPFLSEEKAKSMKVEKAELEEIFSTCQTISNHLANLPATVGILNKKHFSLMGDTATFINTGRGAQVVEEDLIDALKAVKTRTAVLDVTMPEPPNADSELLTLQNVFLTPHIAGSNGNEVYRMAEYAYEEFIRYENNEPLKYNVTLKMLETMA